MRPHPEQGSDARHEPSLEAQLSEQQSFLKRLARGLVQDPGTADDLVQDTLLLALRQRPHGRGAAGPQDALSLRAWLATTLRRLVSGEWRARARRAERERRAARSERIGSSGVGTDDVERRLDVHAELTAALRRLPEAQSRAILLRYGDDLSPREIAARSGEPEATVKARLRRGLAQLRAELDARHGGERALWVGVLQRLDTAPVAAEQGAIRTPTDPSAATAPARALLGSAGAAPLAAGALAAAVVLAASVVLVLVWRGGQAQRTHELLLPSDADPNVGPTTEMAALGGVPSSGVPTTPRVATPSASEVGDERVSWVDGPWEASAVEDRPAPPAPAVAAREGSETEEATMHVSFVGDVHATLSGTLRLMWDDRPERVLEVRGRSAGAESGFDLAVPPHLGVTIEATLDGHRCAPVMLRTPSPGERVDATLLVEDDPAWARLRLRIVHDEPLDGRRFFVKERSGQVIAMPMRGPQVSNGVLDCGRYAAGPFVLEGVDYAAVGAGNTAALVFSVQGSLAAGEDALIDVQVVRSGSFRVEALGADGKRLPAAVEIALPSGQRWTTYTKSPTRRGPGLDVRGPSVLIPPLHPGAYTLHFTCDGYAPAAVDVVATAGVIEDLTVRMVGAQTLLQRSGGALGRRHSD